MLSADEVSLLWKVVAAIGLANVLGLVATWALLQKRVGDLEDWRRKQDQDAKEARAEAERQQAAWWERIGEIKTALAELDRACSNATVELRTKIAGIEHRIDTHSQSNVANLAGIVRNYNDMLVQTLDTLKEALRQAAKGNG